MPNGKCPIGTKHGEAIDTLKDEVGGMREKIDNVRKQLWLMGLVVIIALAGIDKLPLILKALGG